MGAADTAAPRPALASSDGGGGARPAGTSAASGAAGSAGLRVIKFFCAICLIPACVGFSIGAHDHFLNTWSRMHLAVNGPGVMLKWFIGGGLMFGIVAVLLWRPIVLYVFGHELAHALATWMCLGKVSNLTASASGGQVTTSKTNTFIRLAPYCVPLYALLVIGVFAALNQWWQTMAPYMQYLALALGFFYAFHMGFTLWSLRRDQPDLKPDGWLFSLVLIYFANLAVCVLLMGFLFHGKADGSWQALHDSVLNGWKQSGRMYQNFVAAASDLVK